MIIGFIIWVLGGILFLGFGISSFHAKEAVGFWANVEKPQIENVTAYNREVGKMWCVFSVIFMLLGFPFLIGEQNSPLFFITVVGLMLEIIITAIYYSLKIEPKYQKDPNNDLKKK